MKEELAEISNRFDLTDNIIQDYSKRLLMVEDNVRNLNEYVKFNDNKVEIMNSNVEIMNNNLQEQIGRIKRQIDHLKKETNRMNQYSSCEFNSIKELLASNSNINFENNKNSSNIQNNYLKQDATVESKAVTSEEGYGIIDYFDFEDHFRGSREHIKSVQEQYLPYFEGRKRVADLGCGRGEFLELLKENEIGAIGADFYQEFADYCVERNLQVECGDAIEFLRKQEALDGIFVGQVIEHLTTKQVIEICNLAYEKLEEGSYLILETPNPTALSIFTHAFYIDPSHEKPVHPLTMEYFLQKAGFAKDKISIKYSDISKLPTQIPALKADNIENIDDYNAAMQEVSETLFGSQDYAIIAQR